MLIALETQELGRVQSPVCFSELNGLEVEADRARSMPETELTGSCDGVRRALKRVVMPD